MNDREILLSDFDSKNALRTMADRQAVGAYVDAVLTEIHTLAAGAPYNRVISVELIKFSQALERQLYANESHFVTELRSFFDSHARHLLFRVQDVVARQIALRRKPKLEVSVEGCDVDNAVNPRSVGLVLLKDGRWRITRKQGSTVCDAGTRYLPDRFFDNRGQAVEFAVGWLEGFDVVEITIDPKTGCVAHE